MRALIAFLQNGDHELVGRVVSLPFLLSSWGALTASAIVHLMHGGSVIDDVATLALIGFSLFTGSKYLAIRGAKVTANGGESTPGEA